LLTLMPWAAYFGPADVIVSILALTIGFSRLDWRGIALALVALIGGVLIAHCVGTTTGSGRRCADPRHHNRHGQSACLCRGRAAAARIGAHMRCRSGHEGHGTIEIERVRPVWLTRFRPRNN
jgi:hypothetical protein